MIYRLYNIDKYPDYDIVFFSKVKIDSVYLEFLELLGINKNRIKTISESTRFSAIIVPEPCIIPGIYYSPQYLNMFKKITDNAMKTSVKKLTSYNRIYFSRRKFRKARLSESGEIIIEKILKYNDFEIMHFEELSICEHVYYINNAKLVATLSGTNGHNYLYDFYGGDYIIFERTNLINFHQNMFEAMKADGKSRHVKAYAKWATKFTKSYGEGPFLIWTSEELMNFCKEYGLNIPNLIDVKIQTLLSFPIILLIHALKNNTFFMKILNAVRYFGRCLQSKDI